MKFLIQIVKFFLTWLVIPAFLIYIGYSQTFPLFTGEFTQHLGSIEVSYIQMARFIADSHPKFLWQPNWYLGYPMSMLYTPLVPFFEYLGNIFLHFSYSHAYRFITAIGYIGGIVSVYFLGRKISQSWVGGFIASLIFSISPSIVSLMVGEVGADTLLTDFIEPRKLTNLVRWGEGPHIVSLFFLPFAGLFFLKYLENNRKLWMFLAVIFSGLVAMTNSVGTWALILLDFSLIFGNIIESPYLWKNIIKRAFSVTVLTYGVIAFWFNPLFISNFFREGGTSAGYWSTLFPWGFVGIFTGMVIFFLFANKFLRKITGFSSVLIFFLLTFIIIYEYYFSGSKLELVPQALRLSLELDMAVALGIGYILAYLVKISIKIHKFIPVITSTILLILLFIYLNPKQKFIVSNVSSMLMPLETTGQSLQTSPMYRTAQSMQKMVTGDERVFVGGNYAFYLNYFSDIPQLRGALYQSDIHPWAEHIYYQVVTGDDAEISLAWLKIANIGWLVVSGPGDIYANDFKNPDKFSSILDYVKEDLGDIYYKVPLINSSLAKSVAPSIVQIKKPFNAIDKQPIMDYVKILENDPGKLKINQINNGAYQISGTFNPQELILVQQTYVDGWQAVDQNGKNLEVKKDPLGFILIKPQSSTNLVNLTYQNPLQVKIGTYITILTMIIIFLILIKNKKLKEENKTSVNPVNLENPDKSA